MMGKFGRAVEIGRSRGMRALFRAFVGFLVRRLRPFTPWLDVSYNGVIVRRHRLIERFVPWIDTEPRPDYEGTLVGATQNHVSPGEKVIILGGGTGVTTIHAARSTGSNGEVYVYEASREMVQIHKRTLESNPVDAHVEITHGIVGKSGEIWGELGDAQQIPIQQLQIADTIIIDIEGAEADVVPSLPQVETMLVETHGNYGSPTDKMATHLRQRGYTVEVAGVAEPSMRREHVRNDVRVIVATNPPSTATDWQKE